MYPLLVCCEVILVYNQVTPEAGRLL